MIYAIDPGRHMTKFCSSKGFSQFPSKLGEWYDRTGHRDIRYGEFDFEIEYKGEKWFGGTLAEYACDLATTIHADNAKTRIENLVLILTCLHSIANEKNIRVITCQPIIDHTDENKRRIKQMLEGTHKITINDIPKTLNIVEAAVACEGGVAAYSLNQFFKVLRILDFGSATINAATLIDGKFIPNQSGTLRFGFETSGTIDFKRMAAKTNELTRKWNRNDELVLLGGGAGEMFPYIKEDFHKTILHPQAQYANVLGLWKVANSIWQ